jgi:uncharacterized protein YbcI
MARKPDDPPTRRTLDRRENVGRSRCYGKGPTKAKTHMVNDTVICILRGGFTTVERTLIDQGNVDPVYEMRRGFQTVMEEQFTAIVEDATGRHVIAYMSLVWRSFRKSARF